MIDQSTQRERARFWRDPALGNLELLHAQFVTHSFAPHMHDGFAIGVIERGAEQFRYRRATHVAPAGSVVVVDPAEVHTGEAATAQGWTYRMLYPSAALVQCVATELARQPRAVPSFADAVINDPPLAQLIVRLHQALAEPASALERESRLRWTLAQLITRHAAERLPIETLGPERGRVQRVRAFIEQHAAEHITLDQLAALVHLSPFHLLRVFRAAVGMPPHAYMQHVRIDRAKTLLAAGLPIADVALETGFSDQSHLSRQFKRVVGVPPGQYTADRKIIQDQRRPRR